MTQRLVLNVLKGVKNVAVTYTDCGSFVRLVLRHSPKAKAATGIVPLRNGSEQSSYLARPVAGHYREKNVRRFIRRAVEKGHIRWANELSLASVATN